MASPDSNPDVPASQPEELPAGSTAFQIPTTVILRAPSTSGKDAQAGEAGIGETNTWQSPPLNWLARTWTVTHSTLPMWRKAKNVRITYKLIPSTTSQNPETDMDTLIDDEVCSEPTAKTFLPQPKSIRGIDTPDHSVPGGAAWNWRGKGWLKIASSHWEILGWGEFEGEKWVLTWFEKSMFTPAAVDLYSERRGGVSERLLGEVKRVLGEGQAGEGVKGMCGGEELFPVVIDDA